MVTFMFFRFHTSNFQDSSGTRCSGKPVVSLTEKSGVFTKSPKNGHTVFHGLRQG